MNDEEFDRPTPEQFAQAVADVRKALAEGGMDDEETMSRIQSVCGWLWIDLWLERLEQR